MKLGRVLINVRMSGFGGEAEILCSTRALPVLIPSRHRQIESAGSERGLGRCAIALDGDDRRARSAQDRPKDLPPAP